MIFLPLLMLYSLCLCQGKCLVDLVRRAHLFDASRYVSEHPEIFDSEKIYKDITGDEMLPEMSLAEGFALSPINLMDEPIPSEEEPFLDAPLQPILSGHEDPDALMDFSSQDGAPLKLTNNESTQKDEKNEGSQEDEKNTGSQNNELENTPADFQHDYQEEEQHIDEHITASGVLLKFVSSQEETPSAPQETNVQDSKDLPPEKASLSKFKRISEATRRALKNIKDWIMAKLWRTSSADSVLIEKFKENAASIPDNYNIDTQDNEYYEVGYAFSPKLRTKESQAKYSKTGQDSFFLSKVYGEGEMALGVTEGIDDWLPKGRDSSDFSRELCHQMNMQFRKPKTRPEMCPSSLLQEAFDEVKVSNKVDEGSATALVGVFTPRKTVQVENLGFSKAMLFREGSLKYQTTESGNEQGGPRRLTKAFRLGNKRKHFLADSVKDASTVEWDLQRGDYVMFASDGITKNVNPRDMEMSLKRFSAIKANVATITSHILGNAFFRSMQTPEKGNVENFYGGHQDDITIILVKIKK
ncbi:hypothetical protein JCM33374_g1528 [Metschnikowia sp. JCM 33374]|nr:hypothetical protein JCM33374_g1528 [Metschnikowia sp. JCM 33374]